MNPPSPSRLSPRAFEELLREHHDLVHLTNELEFQVYGLGEHETPTPERIAACQRAAGELIDRLRQTLFRLDQQVFPLLAPAAPPNAIEGASPDGP